MRAWELRLQAARHPAHTFWNAGPEPAHLLEVIWPAGFEQFFAELGELVATYRPEELAERRAEIARATTISCATSGCPSSRPGTA